MFVDQVFNYLVKMFDMGKVTPEGRDSAMELVTKNVTYKKGLAWTGKFLDTDGKTVVVIYVSVLCDVVSHIPYMYKTLPCKIPCMYTTSPT